MGFVKVKAVVANPMNRGLRQEIELLADTGAMYTFLPGALLQRLGVSPTGQRKFKLASGEIKKYPVGEAYVEVQGVGATTIVVFGPRRAIPVLGVVTLEALGLQVDPLTGKLKPLELLLV